MNKILPCRITRASMYFAFFGMHLIKGMQAIVLSRGDKLLYVATVLANGDYINGKEVVSIDEILLRVGVHQDDESVTFSVYERKNFNELEELLSGLLPNLLTESAASQAYGYFTMLDEALQEFAA